MIIPGNTCYYSDTDTVILQKELPNNWNLVGRELGQIIILHKLLEGIPIIRCYMLLKQKKNRVIIKPSGINAINLTYDDLLNLAKGDSIELEFNSFILDCSSLKINVSNRKLNGIDKPSRWLRLKLNSPPN